MFIKLCTMRDAPCQKKQNKKKNENKITGTKPRKEAEQGFKKHKSKFTL